MTAYWQAQCVYMGQQQVFEQASEVIEKLMGTQVTAKQLERLCHCYGQLAGEWQAQQADALCRVDERLHYAMVDGGMVLTREDDWKEMKLARLFADQDHFAQSTTRSMIHHSDYVAHLGGYRAFFNKLLPLTDSLSDLVWIADGARWIWDQVATHYPDSVQILDYYHCKEKLCEFAKETIKDPIERSAWIEEQEDLFFADQAPVVVANVSMMTCQGKARQLQRSLLTYYENNLSRMRYKTYRDQHLLIGSGPMEAAHRHVIQHRMKLSGQRWTIQGAQQMATLRCLNKSGRWKLVKDLICHPN
ncbi:MAG: hypothetical protein WBA23_04765 [Tunicatimonas sp.]|uniref:hypothetical protein n=1 Tax=Tunicatimonas sp. TaxID=1940096 RepID=UPI003C75BC85